MKKVIRIIYACLFSTLLVACATGGIGEKFDGSYVQRIESGKTTKEEVLINLGKPLSVSSSSQGEVWTYQYVEGQSTIDTLKFVYGLGSVKQKSNSLTIIFLGDYVKDFNYTASQ